MTTDIQETLASTTINASLKNEENRQRRVSFRLAFPRKAFVSGFRVVVDATGTAKTTTGDKSKRDNSNGGLNDKRIYSMDANVFKISMTLEKQEYLNMTVSFEEALERQRHMYEHKVNLQIRYPVQRFSAEYSIKDSRPLKFVRTAALQTSHLQAEGQVKNDFSEMLKPSRNESHEVRLSWAPAKSFRRLSARFAVQYDVTRRTHVDVLDQGDYFMISVDPGQLPFLTAMDIIFVVDISACINSSFFHPLQSAVPEMISKMGNDDRYHIIRAGEEVSVFNATDELVQASNANATKKAREFLSDRQPVGSADIQAALIRAIKILKHQPETKEKRRQIIMFISCISSKKNRPYSQHMIKSVTSENTENFPIVSVAVEGFMHFTFLKKLSEENFGFVRKVFDTPDLKSQLLGVFFELSNHSLTMLRVVGYIYAENKTDAKSYLAVNGSEFILSGYLQEERKPLYAIHLMSNSFEETNIVPPIKPKASAGVLERLWAHTHLKQLLIRYGKLETGQERQKIEDSIKKLCQSYSLQSPVTSMVMPNNLEKTHRTEVEDESNGASLDIQIERGRTKRRKRDRVIISLITLTGFNASSREQAEKRLCLMPLRLRCDVLVLARNNNGWSIYLTGVRPIRKQKSYITAKRLIFRDDSYNTVVFLDEVRKWIYRSNALHQNIQVNSDTLLVRGIWSSLEIRRVPEKNRMTHIIDVAVMKGSYLENTTGLLGMFRRKTNSGSKKRDRQAKQVCDRHSWTQRAKQKIPLGKRRARRFCRKLPRV